MTMPEPIERGPARSEIRARCEEGIAACQRGDWRHGVAVLSPTVTEAWLWDDVPSTAYSYLGYGRAVLGEGYLEALRLCRLSVKRNAFQPDNYLNLARTCLLRGRRRLAVQALNRGLRVSPGHPELLELRLDLGRRRPPVVPLLHRNNVLNIYLGKLRHRLFIRPLERRLAPPRETTGP